MGVVAELMSPDEINKHYVEQKEELLSLLHSTYHLDTLIEKVFPFGKPKDLLDTLILILNNPSVKDLETRVNALKLIFVLDKELCRKMLINGTRDEDRGIRMHACGTLTFYPPDQRISDCLEIVLKSDPDVDVRLVAVFALEKVGTLSSVNSLRWAKENDDEENWESRKVSDYANDAIEAIKSRPAN